jgi:Domain of unknown function (DUF4129)
VLRRWLPLLAVAALLAAALVAAVFAEPQLDVAALPDPASSGNVPGGPSGPSASASAQPASQRALPVVLELPDWVDSAVSVTCLVVIAVVVLLLLWYVVRDTAQARGRPIAVDTGTTHAPVPHAAEVAAALDAGIAGLSDVDTDPRHAVIACWVRLEQTAADAGTPRRASDAPAEYVLRLLSAHRVSRPVLDRFAAVYRWARYGNGPVDESMRATAVSALRQLRDELTAEVRT